MLGRIEISTTGIAIKLPIELMREGDRVVVYTHALDLCGYGKTPEDAKKDFGAAVKIFFEETLEHKTLDEALEALGWKKVGLPMQQCWEPQVELISSSLPLEEITIPA